MTHPSRETIQTYARGHADLPQRLLVQAHLALCPTCARFVGEYERADAVLPAGPDGADPPAFARVWAAIERMRARRPARGSAVVPAGLLCELPDPERWHWIVLTHRGVRTALLVRDPDSGSALYLSHYPRRSQFPAHAHLGVEDSVVIAGGYQDGERHVERGDWVTAAAGTAHAPTTAADEECWCLARVAAPGVRFRGWRRFAAWWLGR